MRSGADRSIGSYTIVRELGRGGMGVVYLGRDTRLDRDVAIKSLPEQLAQDPERLARFEREAKTLAQLNHTHVAGIYGVEEHEGARYLVLEYVEGETLADRLKRGALPVDEALEIAVQIAAGVDAAHGAGIIHRDLKPGNVMLTAEGQAKVLDFGLARAEETSPASAVDVSPDSPTVTATPGQQSPTMPGVILGTAAYMSPEQARGRKVDKRTDIWSFGVVLYEMLTGRNPFAGETVGDTIGTVLHKEVPFDRLPVGMPPMVRHALRRCLARDKSVRLRDIGDVAIELRESPHDDRWIADVGGGGKPRIGVTVLAAAALLFGLGWMASMVLMPDGGLGLSESEVMFAQIAAPADAVAAYYDGFALSPDGDTLAFAATDASGRRWIWTRRLDKLDAKPVAGTDGGSYPAWSPDGAHLAFFAEDELRRVPADGGQTLVICKASGGQRSASWGPTDVILFSRWYGLASKVSRVEATGGVPVVLEELGPAAHPAWLGDGERFLYVYPEDEWELRLGSVSGGESVAIERLASYDGFTYSSGYVFLNRSDALTVQRFDEATEQMVGSAAAISGVAGTPRVWFAVSAVAGRLVGLVRSSRSEAGDAGDPPSRFEWVDRNGEPIGVLGPPGRYWTMRISPDERRVAANQRDSLWVLAAASRSMLLSSSLSFPPVWSADGANIISWHAELGPVRQPLQPGSVPTVFENAEGVVCDLSSDGRWLLLRDSSGGSHDLVVYDVVERATKPWLATEHDEMQARFSPDGQWVAYVSNAGGRRDVYVRPFEGEGLAVIASSAGGMHPIWRGDGEELFYLSLDGAVMAAEINATQDDIDPGRPTALFRRPLNNITVDDFAPYDVASGGRRFLLNVPDRPQPLLFVQGWEELVP